MTSTYVYLILAWSPRNWMDRLSHSASVRFVSLPCKMERVMPLHPVPRVPNVCSQKQQVRQLLRLPLMVTTVQVLLFQVRSLLLEESDLFPKWFLRLSLAVPLPFCLGPCFTLRPGKKYTSREDLASPPVNLWPCLHAYSHLPLCGVSTNTPITFTCSLAQFFLHTRGLYSLRFTLSSASFVSSLCVIVIGLKTSTDIVQL